MRGLFMLITVILVILLIVFIYRSNQKRLWIKSIIPSTSSTLPVVAKECTSNNQCRPDQYCVGGVCQVKVCSTSLDCESDHECIRGVCQIRHCLSNTDCLRSQVCIDRVCINRDQSCINDSDCHKGLGICKIHRCIWKVEGMSCKSRRECDGINCVNHVCQLNKGKYGERCTDHIDCDQGMVCRQNYCIPTSRL